MLALALLAAGGLTCAPQAQAATPAAQAHAASDLAAWSDCAALEKRLSATIRQQFKGADKAAVQAFLTEPANRLLLLQWQFAHAENAVDTSQHAKRNEQLRNEIERHKRELATIRMLLPAASDADAAHLGRRASREEEAMKSAEQELASPRTMKEALKDPATAKIFSKLLEDEEWMEQMAFSGEFRAPGRALAILSAIAKEFPEVMTDRVARDIATATALEWTKSNWALPRALGRARFYIENNKDNRFHRSFRSLPFWQMRVICGCKADNANGSDNSLRWALDNVHLPIDQYSGCCWQANYLDTNLFGESIHGPFYYAPYDDVYGDNATQRSKEIGGVCGSLSHFGAFAALANGVPALTAGEPGHCAYIVCVNGKWTPAYSLSWERGMHWQVWQGIYVFSALHMATELYGPEQKKQTELSNACCTLGLVTENLGLLRGAVKTQPRNLPVWRHYVDFAREKHEKSAKVWYQLNQDVCKYLVPLYPEMASELLKQRVYPNLGCLPNKQVAPAFSVFWKEVKGMGPDRWAIEALCNKQLELLQGRLKQPNAEDKEALAATLYGSVLKATADNPAYAPAILAWGNGMAAKMNEKMQKRFLNTTVEAISKGKKGGMDTAARDRMLGQAILGAERMRDRSAFQAIGKLLSPNYRENKHYKMPAWEPFPGKLVSQGGLLYTSSTCQHDDPAAHWGVLEPTGGRFHTGSDKDAWAVVQLPKTAVISGVVTVAPEGNLWRLTNMKVQYSESGRDDDWHDAGALPNPTGQRVNRLDLREDKLRARYIRILRPGGPQLFHLFGIYVYGKPAA